MNFQQLRSVRVTVQSGFNLTEVATILCTSQPGVSRQIRELEEELRVDIFVRAENLKRAGEDFACRMWCVISGPCSPVSACTCTRARQSRWPRCCSRARPTLAVATEALALYPQLVTLPCYRWTHSIVVPPDHPLLAHGDGVTLQQLADYPIITCNLGYTGRSHIDDAFARAALQPDIVLTAMDADVIKTYVELGMGVGIITSIALDAERDTQLCMLNARHLFEINLTHLAVRRGTWLRGYTYSFIETFAPTLTRAVVQRALSESQAVE
jgi:LysR family cys regulon transcriptional activator